MGDPDKVALISLSQQIAAVRREIELRARVYPRWVHAGRMTEAAAAKEKLAMQAVLETLEAIQHDKDAVVAPF